MSHFVVGLGCHQNQTEQGTPSISSPWPLPSSMTTSSSSLQEDNQAFSAKRLEEVFNKFKDEDDDAIGPNGMEKFCCELEVDPEDVRC